MNLLIINIKQLVQADNKSKAYVSGKQMSKLPIIKDAFLYVE